MTDLFLDAMLGTNHHKMQQLAHIMDDLLWNLTRSRLPLAKCALLINKLVKHL
jgi:hypothetical protein